MGRVIDRRRAMRSAARSARSTYSGSRYTTKRRAVMYARRHTRATNKQKYGTIPAYYGKVRERTIDRAKRFRPFTEDSDLPAAKKPKWSPHSSDSTAIVPKPTTSSYGNTSSNTMCCEDCGGYKNYSSNSRYYGYKKYYTHYRCGKWYPYRKPYPRKRCVKYS